MPENNPIMAEAVQKLVPPYPSHTLFARFIDDLAQIATIPRRIDKSTFPELSHGDVSSLLGGLRYLKLIGSDSIPSASLVQLVATRSSPKTLKPIVQEAYAFVFADQPDLTQATAKTLADRFLSQGLSGGTVPQAVAFFIALT